MNAINLIAPYKHEGIWVFDDPKVNLLQEPFVSGADSIIDLLVAKLANPENGFNLLFSSCPFPDYTISLSWQREEYGGNWYYCSTYGMEGWLCPALYRYFKHAPEEIYVKAESKE